MRIMYSQIRKTLCSKLVIKSPLPKQGRHGKEDVVNSLMRKPNVNEEYKEAFRTKSYIEICNKVQDQLEIRSLTSGDLDLDHDHDDEEGRQYLRLSEYLLQPPHQRNPNFHVCSHLESPPIPPQLLQD
ncbi:UNVERIFIED_CONTAM: hypothetical protein Slati_2567200 [Sesamum latifolium]|uniref:Uncharacterized protein n=1 Tax=Sesamum latifolium TaxID=2727402 RepID=A0AAW2VTH8_9LAMI